MSNYANTKAVVAANVYTNNNNEVTAAMVKTAINDLIDTLIAGGYMYGGVAKPGDAATSPDANVFYLATEPGTYTNKGGLVVSDGEVAFLIYDGSWTKQVVGSETATQVSRAVNGYELAVTFPNDGFIDTSGVISTSTSYKRTDLIPVYEGQRISLSLNATPSVLVVAAYSDFSTDSFINDSIINFKGANALTTYSFNVPKGVRAIILSRAATDTASNSIVYNSLIKETNDLSLLMYGGSVTPDFYVGYIKTDGTDVPSTGYRVSDFLRVFEGQTVSFKSRGSTSVLLLSGYSDNVQSSWVSTSPVNVAGVVIGGISQEVDVNVVIPSGINYIRICKEASYTGAITLSYGDGIKSMAEETAEIVNGGNKLISFPNGNYVKTTGELVASSSYSLSDFIPVSVGQLISFTSAGSASVLLLSGYTSASQDDFTSTELNTVGNNDPTVSVSKVVPEGVRYIRICKLNTYTAPIYIYYPSVTEKLDAVTTDVGALSRSVNMQHSFPYFKSTSPRKACILFQMDWGYRAGATYKEYHDLLKEHGVEQSLYAVEPIFFNQDLPAMKSLYYEGNEIALHTDSGHSDISSESELSVAQFRDLMQEYHEEMQGVGLDFTGCVVLSTNLKSDFYPVITDYFNWVIAGPVDMDAMDDDHYANAVMGLSSNYKFPMRLGIELTQEQYAIPANEVLVANRAIECIDTAIANRGFLILYCHSYMSNAPYTLRQNTLVPILEHLQDRLLAGECLTGRTSDLLEYYYSKRFDE